MKEYLSKIRKAALFQNIPDNELEVLLDDVEGIIRHYNKGEIILPTDEHPQFIGVLLEGRIHMVKENTNGDEILVTIIWPGELFGESFACNKKSISCVTFITEEETTVLMIPFQKIISATERDYKAYKQLQVNIIAMLAEKNMRLMQKIGIVSQKTLRDKILAYLQMQVQEQGTEKIDIPVSRTVMAEYLGVNRSALARELSLMQKEGLLDMDHRHFDLHHT